MSIPPSSSKDMFTLAEFLDLYSISRNMFYSEVKKKKLIVRKIGHRVFIHRKDADHWMNNMEIAEI